ncbi:SH3 domain-containing protein [Burkholderiaceae bacterium FT117]|uniref:SH3 domain-containing protein n=1 Tax=Zeimonas sediminis TaxID=2944268 RepID=UPI002342C538|nr:SH3 domain-containing protein [Zeimonas sediminis]MCM5571454.1 SH3 domain-containing protein [Zeimonas sediminis]
MSRTRTLSLTLALAASLFTPAAHAVEMVTVDRDVINMRAGPGTGHQATWRLNRGYPLIVTARKNGWLAVRDFEDDTGWVLGRLTAKKPHFIVKKQDVNIRSGPGTRYKVVGKAKYGEVLRTLERRSGWAKVRNADGLTGWVSRKLLWGW